MYSTNKICKKTLKLNINDNKNVPGQLYVHLTLVKTLS